MKNAKLLFSFIMVGFALSMSAATFGLGGAVAVGGVMLFGKTVNTGAVALGVNPEIWVDYVVGNLFKDNEFMLQSVDESQYVIGVGVVHIPQAGAPSGVKRNRQLLPATITRRSDIDVTYVLDEFTTDPRIIPNIDQAELSYDKMDSCMMEDMMYLRQFIAEDMIYQWRPSFFVRTSGASTPAHVGTSAKKAITVQDFVTAKETMNKWGIPKADRYCLIDTDMKGQLVAELKANANRDYSVIYNPLTGEIDKLEGFKLFERQNALVASAPTITQVAGLLYRWTSTDLTYTPEQVASVEAGDTSYASTACAVALCWHKSMVARAVGQTEMFDDQGNPQYYGDIYSFLQRAGGRKRRGDGKGVIGIIQVAA